VKTVASAIESELEGHGERVMGKEMIHWSTRLEKVEDCRAEFTVRTILALQLDGDAESAQRLQAAFRAAVDSCRQPSRVTF
jgi:hypothetical protein